MKTLVAWIGRQDLDGAAQSPSRGPIVDFLRVHSGVKPVLLSDWPEKETAPYVEMLDRSGFPTDVREVLLKDPTDYLGIYRIADKLLAELTKTERPEEIAVHTSPGTPSMAAVWVLLGKTKYAGVRLFKSWIDRTTQKPKLAEVDIPFELTLDVLPDLTARHAKLLAPLSSEELPPTTAFDPLIHKSEEMRSLIGEARKAALFPQPVLILGESGTGKELLARAIHEASPRANEPYAATNCAAIPADLLDAELFGHAKGAFTGATNDRVGRIESCDRGTLFLDEIGDISAATQVRLLRVLQEGEIQPVGRNKPKKVDVRIIAATHRDLMTLVREGSFREDLFYRVAVLVVKIPPLRERSGDVLPLSEFFLDKLNSRALTIPGSVRKHLSPSAKRFAEQYPWPGNVRELENTLARVFVMTSGDTIRAEDIESKVIGLLPMTAAQGTVGNHKNIKLNEELQSIERRFIEQALRDSGGVREKAARLLGLASRQALSHRMRRLGIEL